MRITQLTLKDFGPFKKYRIKFLEEDGICLLLTGKNNEGKSSLISSLKLLHAATKVIGKRKQEIRLDGEYYYELLKQDTENLLIGRMIHNYSDNIGQITGEFQGLKINVYLDPKKDRAYADYQGRVPTDVQKIFGFIPPLGPLSENEEIITEKHLNASIDTSLAPRHLRNHFYQILKPEEMELIRQIIKKSWQGIELLDYKLDYGQGRVFCYYKEDRVDREISWAGQGLQVWFQIIAHTVRLRDSSILILDEPEINLHPEKQNELIRILKDYYQGSIVIATHSIELMNNVSVSHIINVKKKHSEPKIKSTEDRIYLNFVRSQVGSNFNLIASQFDEFDLIVFTEDTFDFEIIRELAEGYRIRKKAFNIPIHGFSEYRKCISYKHAYELLIGKTIAYSVVLDRDYYPEEYLRQIKTILNKAGIRITYTPGKELENIFLSPEMISALIPEQSRGEFAMIWGQLFDSSRISAYGSYQSLHEQFVKPKMDPKSITTKFMPIFERCWNDPIERYKIVEGKEALKVLRAFYRDKIKRNLSQTILIETLLKVRDQSIKGFIEEVFHAREAQDRSIQF